jgi:hypothetical protein
MSSKSSNSRAVPKVSSLSPSTVSIDNLSNQVEAADDIYRSPELKQVKS